MTAPGLRRRRREHLRPGASGSSGHRRSRAGRRPPAARAARALLGDARADPALSEGEGAAE